MGFFPHSCTHHRHARLHCSNTAARRRHAASLLDSLRPGAVVGVGHGASGLHFPLGSMYGGAVGGGGGGACLGCRCCARCRSSLDAPCTCSPLRVLSGERAPAAHATATSKMLLRATTRGRTARGSRDVCMSPRSWSSNPWTEQRLALRVAR